MNLPSLLQIGVISGVLLISWRQAVLQKQIDYGAKLGHVVLSLAKMELENFFKNVMPVADFFDQSDLLLAVSRASADDDGVSLLLRLSTKLINGRY